MIATSVDSGLESSIIVGRDERKASLLVNPADDHHVRVIVFDHCRQNFTSKPVYVEGLPKVSTIQLSSSNYKFSSTEGSVNVSSSVVFSCSTVEPQQCSKKEANNEGIYIKHDFNCRLCMYRTVCVPVCLYVIIGVGWYSKC